MVPNQILSLPPLTVKLHPPRHTRPARPEFTREGRSFAEEKGPEKLQLD